MHSVKNRHLSDPNKMLKYYKHCRDYQLVLNFIFDFEETKTITRDMRTNLFFDSPKRRNDQISA